MENKAVQTFVYPQTQKELRIRPGQNNTIEINAEDAALGMGYTSLGIDGDESVNWALVKTTLTSRGYDVGELNADSYISENMFYQLAMQSQSPAAIPFQRWAADDVFVSIRKDGFYVNPNAAALDNFRKMLQLKTRQESIATRNSFTAVLKIFIEYAQQQGDDRDKSEIYEHYTTLANKIAGIPNGHRPKATSEQNIKIKNVENAMANLFIDGMVEKKHYKEIELDVQIKSAYVARIVLHKNPLLLK